MYLNQLETFVNVVKTGSFSQTARKMFLSQPTISAHIKSLESELNVQLLIRSNKDVILSDAGKFFYPYALKLLQDRDEALTAMEQYQNTPAGGIIAISATEVPAQYLFPKLLSSLLKQHPEIHVTFREMPHNSILKSLESTETELGISVAPGSDTAFCSEIIAEDQLVLIAPNTALFRHMGNSFPAEQFLAYPFLMPQNDIHARNAIASYLTSIGHNENELHIVAELPSYASIIHAVIGSSGLAFVSRHAAADLIQNGLILEFPVDSEHLKQNLYLIRNKNRLPSTFSNKVSAFLRNSLGNNSQSTIAS